MGSEIKYAREIGTASFRSIHADYIIDSIAHAFDSALSLAAARKRVPGSRLGAAV